MNRIRSTAEEYYRGLSDGILSEAIRPTARIDNQSFHEMLNQCFCDMYVDGKSPLQILESLFYLKPEYLHNANLAAKAMRKYAWHNVNYSIDTSDLMAEADLFANPHLVGKQEHSYSHWLDPNALMFHRLEGIWLESKREFIVIEAVTHGFLEAFPEGRDLVIDPRKVNVPRELLQQPLYTIPDLPLRYW